MLKPWRFIPQFVPVIVTHGITFVLGVIGNTLIIIALKRDTRTRSATSAFLISLAVADLLLLLLCVPLNTAEYFLVTWGGEGTVCRLASYVEMLSLVASVLNLTAVSFERYLVVVYPMRSRSLCTLRNCRKALVVVWVLSLLLTVPVLFSRRSYPYTYYNNETSLTLYKCDDVTSGNLHLLLAVYQLVITFVIPLILMSFFYTCVIRVLWTSTKTISELTTSYRLSRAASHEPPSLPSFQLATGVHSLTPASPDTTTVHSCLFQHHRTPETIKNARKQVIKMLILIIALFMLCWGPRLIMRLMMVLGLPFYSNSTYSLKVAFYLLPFVHSCMNPVIYTLMSTNFRRLLSNSSAVKYASRCCRGPVQAASRGAARARQSPPVRFPPDPTNTREPISLRTAAACSDLEIELGLRLGSIGATAD
ncbi:galanin receptor type 2-like isoform X2 [Pollicipes pollicipes]|uniref:galanin receptor type 2-like isoform X2 n=1 Tax=Pollicipes pollicipes TaxID=41117 RepID=UPI001884BBBD|nr:galanin receptor type 2-like isoform X2 [Pollicipes pollicipes]